MSNRLTNDMRGKIVNAVLEHKFNPQIIELANEYAGLANTVYLTAFKKSLEQINSLPDGWLPTDTDIQIEFGAGKMLRLQFNGCFTHRYGSRLVDGVYVHETDFHVFATYPAAVVKRFPANKKSSCVASFEARDKLSITYGKLENRKYDLISGFEKARADTAATIGRFTTIDKLLEVWPEIEPFTKGVAAKPKPQLPAVPVMKLNEMLGLPVDDEGAVK